MDYDYYARAGEELQFGSDNNQDAKVLPVENYYQEAVVVMMGVIFAVIVVLLLTLYCFFKNIVPFRVSVSEGCINIDNAYELTENSPLLSTNRRFGRPRFMFRSSEGRRVFNV
ncbi:hypothetical protein SK128_014660 [Halocaridina rubra]|uniref:Uncharacterized protein n=1 Tax=Halocaridina rubra TaxID=373956 RepID=A0AAN8XID3_HALRR